MMVTRCWGGRDDFKGTNCEHLNRYVSSGELMHSIAISKQYHIINFKVAMILDFNCSYHQKKGNDNSEHNRRIS